MISFLYPTTRFSSVIPAEITLVSTRSRSGLPFTATMHFGTLSVIGRRRTPRPAAMIIACMRRNYSEWGINRLLSTDLLRETDFEGVVFCFQQRSSALTDFFN